MKLTRGATGKLIETAKKKFGVIIEEQLKRVEQLKKDTTWTDYSALNPIIIGVCWGDGIGEVISKHAEHLLAHILKNEMCHYFLNIMKLF